jgi:hypothetical protein
MIETLPYETRTVLLEKKKKSDCHGNTDILGERKTRERKSFVSFR